MFWINYIKLCNKAGISPTAAAVEMGFNRSMVTRWNDGAQPRAATLQKIADYFGVPVSELTQDAENEKKPTLSGEPSNYDMLTPENRVFIDSMIEKLLKSQFDG